MERMPKILVVDDEVKITEVLKAYLIKSGYEVIVAHNGNDAIELCKSNDISLVILDLMLPDIMGENVCKMIRTTAKTPIIMLTAKTEENDLLHGLSLGADDYITKPFSPRIVVAKVEAVLRRTKKEEADHFPVAYHDGYLTIDFQSGIVKAGCETAALTPTEYNILTTMAKAPNRTFSREQLISYALKDTYDGYDRSIDTYIKGIRQKIEQDRKKPRIIVTVHGLGYKFVP